VVVLLIAGTIAARYTKHQVNEGTVEIIFTSGKYSRTLLPGLNFMLPWEKGNAQLQTKERTWTCPEQMAHISPNDDVRLKAMISYQLMPEDAHLAVIQVEKWEESLQDLFKAVLQSSVAHLTPDDFYAWPGKSSSLPSSDGGLRLSTPEKEGASHWGHINLLLKQQMQDRVALWGVQMNWVYIRDIKLTSVAATQIITDPNIAWNTMSATAASTPPVMSSQAFPFSSAGGASTPPIMGNQAQTLPFRAPGRASTPPVMGNQAPPLVLKATAEPRPTDSGAKLPKEEALTSAYIQIKNGVITTPEAIRDVAAGFQAIANDPVASNNASFDAARAAQSLYERARLIENQTYTAPQMSASSSAYRDETPTSGWSIRTPSDDIMPAGN
jgi:SPFH domain / Band 7 family